MGSSITGLPLLIRFAIYAPPLVSSDPFTTANRARPQLEDAINMPHTYNKIIKNYDTLHALP